MLLSELVQEDLVKIELDSRNKWDAIEELVDLLISTHELRLASRPDVVDALFAREKALSTGLERGFAVPHATVECVGEILAAVGLSREGIPFESLDGSPARLIILLIIPKGSAQRHLRTLSNIARLAGNEDFRRRIHSAASPAQVLDAILSFETNASREGQAPA